MPPPELLLFLCLLPAMVMAEEQTIIPFVEDDIYAMDTNQDGQVAVIELRAYLEAKHGKDYQQALLEKMEIKTGPKAAARRSAGHATELLAFDINRTTSSAGKG